MFPSLFFCFFMKLGAPPHVPVPVFAGLGGTLASLDASESWVGKHVFECKHPLFFFDSITNFAVKRGGARQWGRLEVVEEFVGSCSCWRSPIYLVWMRWRFVFSSAPVFPRPRSASEMFQSKPFAGWPVVKEGLHARWDLRALTSRIVKTESSYRRIIGISTSHWLIQSGGQRIPLKSIEIK